MDVYSKGAEIAQNGRGYGSGTLSRRCGEEIPEEAEPAFAKSADAGLRFNDSDVLTMSRLGQAMCLVIQGHGRGGIAMLDEVMVAVASGEVSPMYAGIAYCTMIAGCSDLFDLRRARQWTAALTSWCDSQPDLVPYRGNCLVHRCELMQLEGAWTDALVAARQLMPDMRRIDGGDQAGFLSQLTAQRGQPVLIWFYAATWSSPDGLCSVRDRRVGEDESA